MGAVNYPTRWASDKLPKRNEWASLQTSKIIEWGMSYRGWEPMAFTAIDARGNTVVYRDGKRYLWLLSPILATIPMISLGLYFLTGKSNLTTLIPFAFIFGVIPVMDAWLGEDLHNPPAEIVAAMEADPYYARLAWATVPIYWLSFLSVAYWVGAQTLPWWSWIVLAIGVGTGDGGGGLTVGHELGHKSGRVNRGAAFLANNLCGYGHFRIEHNRGHHTWVSTPEDPASARYGELIYRFAARELPGAFRRGWLQEAERLQRRGKSAWSFENEILQGYAFTFAVAAGLIAAFGLKLALFLAAHHFIGWYSLTQANYVEHYGLLRQTLPNGRYEPVQPRHSWNTNHIFSISPPSIFSAIRTTMQIRCGLISRCAISRICHACRAAIPACSRWRRSRRSGSG